MENVTATRSVFLWCLAAIYLFAFISLYFQIPGLYGKDGLLPARLHLKEECFDNHEKCQHWASVGECKHNPTWMLKNCEVSCSVCKGKRSQTENFWIKPTLLWFAPSLDLSVDSLMDLLCILGASVSFLALVSRRFRNVVSFGFLWFFYFSLYQAGQTFLWFQWDILLLETGFLGIILAPWSFSKSKSDSPRFSMCFWLVRWLIFRLMFQSGIVKLTSHCPTWWGLTALNYHYESQCIPTQLAWYAHQLPVWFQKLSVVATFIIEIPIPFLFFFPWRSIRIFAFYSQMLLQILIILTGNYNFFNLLTIILCFSLIDDEFLLNKLPRFITNSIFDAEDREKLTKRKQGLATRMASMLIEFLVGIGFFHWTVKLFDLKLESNIVSRVAFSKDDLTAFLKVSVPLSIGIGLIFFILEIITAFVKCIKLKTMKEKLIACGQTMFFAVVAIWLFSISLISYTDIERETQARIWPVIHKWHRNADQYQITNPYGLFRSMTGVGGRPEIIIEGSNHINGPWKEYNFKYKPGALEGAPSFLIPHQPRLDWQMWFAALGHYQYNPWFINLIDKLLNNKKDVLALLADNPFPKKAPKYIKSTLYSYHFTRIPRNTMNISEGLAKASKIKRWWKRTKPAEYTPPLVKNSQDVRNFLIHNGIIMDGSWPEHPNGRLFFLLRYLRSLTAELDPTWTMYRLVLAASIICIWKSKVKS